MAQQKRTLEDWLDDLSCRFIINLPQEDLSSIPRICFHIEEAQWFYEDFIRPLNPSLPSMSLRSFSLRMFQHCPLFASFSKAEHLNAFEEFQQYKTRVPVRGVILLNAAMDSAVLVRGYKKGASWSFPRGKISKGETDLDCAIRETYEEIGFDLKASGLVERNNPVHHVEVTMKGQQVQLFVIRGVPEDTKFETMTRKEIGGIRWYKLSELPAFRKKKAVAQDKFYMVAPFMVPLREWIRKQQRDHPHQHPALHDEGLTDDNVAIPMIPEPPQQAHPPVFDPQAIQMAEQELQRALQIMPPTQGVQLGLDSAAPAPRVMAGNEFLGGTYQSGSNLQSTQNDESARLKALLQNPPQPLHGQGMPAAQPGTYLSQPSQLAPGPGPPYGAFNQPHAQRIPVESYNNYPSFEHQLPASYQQSHGRPYVNVPAQQQPQSHFEQGRTPQYHPSQPLQILHPQPLPPQAKMDILARDGNIPSPNMPHAAKVGPQGPSQGMLHMGQAQPAYSQATQFAAQPQQGAHVRLPSANAGAPLNTQSNKLLDLLRADKRQEAAESSGLLSVQQEKIAAAGTLSQTQQPPLSGYPGGASNVQTDAYARRSTSTATNPMMSTGPRPGPAAGSHRSNLLDMFKKASPTSTKLELDGQSVSVPTQPARVPSIPQPPSQQQQATYLRTAAQEAGRPLAMNPETNLPFGALTILSRPRPGQPSNNQTIVSPEEEKQPTRGQFMRTDSRPSPRQSYGKPSPANSQTRAAPISELPAHSLPHTLSTGVPPILARGTPFEAMGHPGSAVQSPSAAAPAFAAPGARKPRQSSTADHKNALLSLFSKPRSGFEEHKAQELAVASPEGFGAGPQARSRLASVASSAGGHRSGSGSGSRRTSQSHMAPEQRDFLLSFLNNASKTGPR